jgi:hypothetical protein
MRVRSEGWWSIEEYTITPDGYRIIPPIPEPIVEKGVQCGHCGVKFENNAAYGYSCPYSRCPVFTHATTL